MSDSTYQTKVYMQQGGDVLVVKPGGLIRLEGTLTGITKGNLYHVDSAVGSDSNDGLSWSTAFGTIDYAIGQCTANNGDVILVAAGHAETIITASGIDLDVAGVTVQGLGQGTNRPTVTFGTSTAATIDFSAANCTLSNIRCVNNVDSLASFIEGGAGTATIEDCDFITSGGKEALCGIYVPTTYDDWAIRRCRFVQPTDPAGTNAATGTGAIFIIDSENVLVEDCEFRGCWETAFIHNKTTAAANLWVKRCYGLGSTSTADAVPFVLVSTATGGAERCSFINPNETQVTEATLSGTFGAGFFNFQSFFGNDGGGGQLAVASQSAAS